MGLNGFFMDKKLSRRSFLQSVSAVTATAVLSGCSSGTGDSDYLLNEYTTSQNVLTFATEPIPWFSTGNYTCGTRCLHNFNVRHGRIVRMTSAGDIPRADSDELDERIGNESGKPCQQRACVRGYGYIQHNYQPNRIKYPLLQTKKRGDLTGFKRISWEDAVELAATKIMDAVNREKELGYLPVINSIESSLSTMTNPPMRYFVRNAGESIGGVESGRFDCVGLNSLSNTRNDRLNTKFLICWGLDPSRTTYYQTQALWMHTKMKEAGKVPLVFIMSTFNDSAAVTGTGVTVDTTMNPKTKTPYKYSLSNSASVKIPRWLACRPATDGALTVAMMYVIYKNDIYDRNFLENKCFGFFDNQQPIVSTTPGNVVTGLQHATRRADFKMDLCMPDSGTCDTVSGSMTKGADYAGTVFKLPPGYSFESYLNGLETGWGRGADDYEGVLRYVAALTGVKAEYIEALAMKYAEPFLQNDGAAMIDVGGGPNRAYNGPEWAWLQICLTAMCGYTDKEGGSCGFNMMTSVDDFYTTAYSLRETMSWSTMEAVYGRTISLNGINFMHIPLTGSDGRTKEQIVADVLFQTKGKDGTDQGLDLSGRDKPFTIEVIGGSHNNYMNSYPNVNKSIMGLKDPSVKFVYWIDNVMTPSATHADLILPMETHLESNSNVAPTYIGTTTTYLRQKLCDTLYEAKSISEISVRLIYRVMEKMGIRKDPGYSPSPEPTEEQLKASYEAIKFTDTWVKKYPDMQRPTWEELKLTGKADIISPSNNPLIGFRDHLKPGELYNSTGRINFFSPFWYIRMAMNTGTTTRGAEIKTLGGPSGDYYGPGWRTATAKYIPVKNGYESFFENHDPRGKFVGHTSPDSKRTYKLMYMTNKARNRAHTVFDSTALLKDQFPQVAKMNPGTAAERGIKQNDMVYIYNDRGCMYIPAYLTHQILPGVVSVEHGGWYRASTDPDQTVTIWLKNCLDGSTVTKTVPVDLGGAENLLTDDDFTMDTVFCVLPISAQTGPCEVSLTKPN